MNLYEEFQILEREKSSFYYDKVNYKPVSNLCYAWKFIEEYFKAGEKESVLNNTYLSELKDNGKHIHTVSMYFLGILFRKLFEDKVKNHLISSLKNQLSYRYDFTYSWFITCLFHDYSRIQENDKFYNKEFSDTDSCFTKNVIEKLHIQHIIFRHKLIDGDAFKTHYREETIKNYFHYRCDYCKKADHGIIAGILLFDRLTKNYNKKWKEFVISNPNHQQSHEYFIHDDLAWRREHLDHFAYIADSIMSHNIWLGTDETVYKKYHLEEILVGKVSKINIKDNPLLFALGLLDTIEPIKVFTEFNPKYVWSNITMTTEANKIIIHVSEKAIFNYLEWFKKIQSLKDWLDVRIQIGERNIEIEFI